MEKLNNNLNCRFCGHPLDHDFIDLGVSPLSNSYLTENDLQKVERFYPLHAFVCNNCFLVQLGEYGNPKEIFSDYAYFSSYSTSWLEHAKNYTNSMIGRFGFDKNSKVIEIASNDGYLLQYFKAKGINVLGIEPASNVAKVAVEKGIPTREIFLDSSTGAQLNNEGVSADLLIGNNVLAHNPNLNDFVIGMRSILNEKGVLTMEFPHLLKLMKYKQFDTIYHEHFSYFSFATVQTVFKNHGLFIFDVEELPTHGGSIRIYACHESDKSKAKTDAVELLLKKEKKYGLDNIDHYLTFKNQIIKLKNSILNFLLKVAEEKKSVAAYGAPAKGNTLLNYCGIKSDLINFTVDISPHKQGLYLPGSRIPIYEPERIREEQPDYVVILPWNLSTEIMEQMSYIRKWGGEFVTFIPEVRVHHE